MPRGRPAARPLSFHKPTGQYYVTRARKRTYLGADPKEAPEALSPPRPWGGSHPRPDWDRTITARELANRFVAAQQANWRNPNGTLRCYSDWLGRTGKQAYVRCAPDASVDAQMVVVLPQASGLLGGKAAACHELPGPGAWSASTST